MDLASLPAPLGEALINLHQSQLMHASSMLFLSSSLPMGGSIIIQWGSCFAWLKNIFSVQWFHHIGESCTACLHLLPASHCTSLCTHCTHLFLSTSASLLTSLPASFSFLHLHISIGICCSFNRVFAHTPDLALGPISACVFPGGILSTVNLMGLWTWHQINGCAVTGNWDLIERKFPAF